MSAAGGALPRDARLALRAPAKLNLRLEVLGRRADGYHELRTVLQAIDLCDEIELVLRPRGDGVAPGAADVSLLLREAGPDVPGDERNLAVRAAHAVLAAAGAAGEVGLDITLCKRIPAGGGLGGGSSDAAAVLRGLDALLGRPLEPRSLAGLAARLGSDVPFFLEGGTALCTGRGERVEPLPPLSVSARQFTLLVPPFGVSTAAVYGALRAPPAPREPAGADARALRADLEGADATALSRLFRNDLEAPARRVEPRLGPLLDREGHHLSGSGSTVFRFGAVHDAPADEPEGMERIVCSALPGVGIS